MHPYQCRKAKLERAYSFRVQSGKITVCLLIVLTLLLSLLLLLLSLLLLLLLMLLITFNIIDITKTTDVMELNTEFMAVPSSLVQPGKPDDTLPVSSNNMLKILNQVECVCM